MDVLPEELSTSLSNVEHAIASLDEHLEPFFSMPLSEIVSSLGTHDGAKLNLVLAYAVNTMFFLLLRTQGLNPNDHPVKQELERIKTYMKRLQETESNTKEKEGNKINIPVASRFIAGSLPQLTPDQRSELKKIARRAEGSNDSSASVTPASPHSSGSPHASNKKKGPKEKRKEKPLGITKPSR
eukprot:TRINITY_DN3201_c0_g1::TRINITY_DN3201_c0_g1_i1::g.3637::m.3637 TRINITY_DN3201_c0_g1::TRINITY_DN3201_c0_g1_i1::g.3637  ORF type:complete len:208 (+),score=11.12,sp/Q32PE4/C1D_BOVIN/39.42/2e-25,Sas10_Utp3/PF04000.10/6.4e-15,Fungal_trans_2/PF11951.3/0.0038,SR-25/PF10500.4/1.3 TRINITY_DN3201_c0_g1_i1:73-624(+)